MRNVCLVTNYNYETFLAACLDSLTSQSLKFDLIIIVDDGSSDDSRDVINKFCRECGYAISILKNNGGQLSCFNAALELIKHDDLVFFIDADDFFPPDYLEKVCQLMAKEAAEFIFVNPVQFLDGQQPLQSASIAQDKTFTFSSTSALTRKTKCFIGAATSCLSIKGSLCHELLPYPYEKDWITRADDVLVFGASILGAHKLHIDSVGISYRVHASNKFTGRNLSQKERADWRFRHERLFQWYSDKAGIPPSPPIKNVLHEAALIPKSIRKQFGIMSPMVLFFYNLLLILPISKMIFRDMVESGK